MARANSEQGQWMIFTAQQQHPKRILEIGCYSGYSALCWYEGTKDTQAEIVTLELSQVMIDASKKAFEKYKVGDRVKLIEGPADESIDKLTGEFDLVFVDANKDGYITYVKQILDNKLLSPNGVILCDNGTSCFASRQFAANVDSLCPWPHGRKRRQPQPQQCCAPLL
jgi:predicted O-methyltransferase YrrM